MSRSSSRAPSPTALEVERINSNYQNELNEFLAAANENDLNKTISFLAKKETDNKESFPQMLRIMLFDIIGEEECSAQTFKHMYDALRNGALRKKGWLETIMMDVGHQAINKDDSAIIDKTLLCFRECGLKILAAALEAKAQLKGSGVSSVVSDSSNDPGKLDTTPSNVQALPLGQQIKRVKTDHLR